MLLLDTQLQRKAPWKSNRTVEVNPVPSDYFEGQTGTGGIMGVTNTYTGSKPYAGAMISTNRILPNLNGSLCPYVALFTKFRWSGWSYENLARKEFDLKVCAKTRPSSTTKIRNVANFSCQWNAETGMWQIDRDPPHWVDTGFVTEYIAPGEWHSLEYRLWYNFNPSVEAECVFSFLSIDLDGDCYKIPVELQNVPMSLTNWEEVAKVQVQNEMLTQGVTVIEYDDLGLAWSNEPIGEVPWNDPEREEQKTQDPGEDIEIIRVGEG